MGIKILSSKKVLEYENEIVKLKEQLHKEKELYNLEKTFLKRENIEQLKDKEVQCAKRIENLKEKFLNDVNKVQKQCDEKIKENIVYAEQAIKQMKEMWTLREKDLNKLSEKELLIKLIMTVDEQKLDFRDAMKIICYESNTELRQVICSELKSQNNALQKLVIQQSEKIDNGEYFEKIASKTVKKFGNEWEIDSWLEEFDSAVEALKKLDKRVDELTDGLNNYITAIGDEWSYDSLRYEIREMKDKLEEIYRSLE